MREVMEKSRDQLVPEIMGWLSNSPNIPEEYKTTEVATSLYNHMAQQMQQGNLADDGMTDDDYADDMLAEAADEAKTFDKVAEALGREFSTGVSPLVRR
jgi:hypothetical protein